ncbi:MAG: Gfo/Idh/MocA family oxidoreductase [Anaerolineales bacterium]|nr:Gfo/Idh/MocA family oxidoreductase [Anaerolineales bacterium]
MTMRVAVIGLGAMGRNHARVYWELPEADLVGVADIDSSLASQIARKYGTRAYSTYRELLDETKPEAVTIATPTVTHYRVALDVIQRGIHVLIEKPISASINEGVDIINQAQDHNVLLMIGHIERFNPAIKELKAHLEANDLGKVIQIDARRQGPYPERMSDVGVVVDLAVHDLDIIRFITAEEIELIYAETAQRLHGFKEDLAVATFRLRDGVVGTLNINWLTPTKIRELSILGEKGLFIVNYLSQDLLLYKNATISPTDWETLQIFKGVREGEMIRFVVNRKEPLRAEQEAFLAAVGGEIQNPVPGEDGLIALRLAQAMINSSELHQAVRM